MTTTTYPEADLALLRSHGYPNPETLPSDHFALAVSLCRAHETAEPEPEPPAADAEPRPEEPELEGGDYLLPPIKAEVEEDEPGEAVGPFNIVSDAGLDDTEPVPAVARPKRQRRERPHRKETHPRALRFADYDGWVKMFRQVKRHPVWTQLDSAVFKVLMHFLFDANYKPVRKFYDGDREIEIPRGSFLTSLEASARECYLTVQQVRTAFSHLKLTGFATYKTTRRGTIVTVCKYGHFQGSKNEEQHNGQHADQHDEQHASNMPTPSRTNKIKGSRAPKKVEEVKNLKKTNTSSSASVDASDSDSVAGWFDSDFWPLYPRKEGKKAALKAARSKAKTPDLRAAILAGLRRQLPALTSREPRYIPHGATWLNDERWLDEIEQQPKNAKVQQMERILSGGYPEWKGIQGATR